jgi:hypothetical protein
MKQPGWQDRPTQNSAPLQGDPVLRSVHSLESVDTWHTWHGFAGFKVPSEYELPTIVHPREGGPASGRGPESGGPALQTIPTRLLQPRGFKAAWQLWQGFAGFTAPDG